MAANCDPLQQFAACLHRLAECFLHPGAEDLQQLLELVFRQRLNAKLQEFAFALLCNHMRGLLSPDGLACAPLTCTAKAWLWKYPPRGDTSRPPIGRLPWPVPRPHTAPSSLFCIMRLAFSAQRRFQAILGARLRGPARTSEAYGKENRDRQGERCLRKMSR
ncbi:hypothetical protein OH76DRAFT_1009026 [Lentinus brumalis]|uniref:Uncharacterized protein n=1 Tax=Lentinus brumalis TaxID=2498619 RepID=A0A371CYA2_9APHY|nr:hypothetical protein OH76DRAFT_1009026 [Polyporus brumalis]